MADRPPIRDVTKQTTPAAVEERPPIQEVTPVTEVTEVTERPPIVDVTKPQTPTERPPIRDVTVGRPKQPFTMPNPDAPSWKDFSTQSGIDDKEAGRYEDALINGMAFDIPATDTLKAQTDINGAMSNHVKAIKKKEGARNLYSSLSALGDSMDSFFAPEVPKSKNGAIDKFFNGYKAVSNYGKLLGRTALNAWIGGSNQLASGTFTGIEIVGQSIQAGGKIEGIIDPFFNPEIESQPESEAAQAARRSVGQFAEDFGASGKEFYAEIAKEHAPPAVIAGKNVVDNPEIMIDPIFWLDGIVRTTPSMVGAMATGLGAGRAVKIGGETLQLTPKVVDRLYKIAIPLFGGAAGGELEGASVHEEAIALGKTPEEARSAFYQMTLASGALNAFSLNILLNKIPSGTQGKVMSWLTTGKLGTAAVGAVGEAVPEGFEEVVGAFILDTDMNQAWKDGLTVALIAAGPGGGTALITRPRVATEPTPEGEEVVTEGEDVAEPLTFEEEIRERGIENVLPEDRAPDAFPNIPPKPAAPGEFDISDLAEQVEAGTLTEDEALAEIERRLTAPPEAPEGIAPPRVPLPEPLPINPAMDELADIEQMRAASPLDLQWVRATRDKAIELVNQTKNDNPGQPRALYRVASKEAKTRGAEGVLPYNRDYATKDAKSGADLKGIYWFASLREAINYGKKKYGPDYRNIAELQAVPLAFMPDNVMAKNITPKGNLDNAVVLFPGDVNLNSIQIKDLTEVENSGIFEIRRPDDTSQRQRNIRAAARGRDIRDTAEPGLPGARPGGPTGRADVLGELGRERGGGRQDLPGRLGEEGAIDLDSEVSIAPILERLQSFRENPAQGIEDLANIGRSIWAEGKTAVEDFTARMREVLGDLWADFKDFARQAWEIVANERGEITIGPEGKPEFEVATHFGNIRFQAKEGKRLPAFMEDNPSWSEDEVNLALDRAEKGRAITEREAEIVHAALAEAGANFYQQVMQSEDDFINPREFLEEGELDAIIEQGINNFVSNLTVVTPVKLTPEQKRRKERTREFTRRGKEIKRLQASLEETADLLHESVVDQSIIKRREQEKTKAAEAEVKKLKSKVATRDKKLTALKESRANAAKAARAFIKGRTGAELARTRAQEVVGIDPQTREALRTVFQAARKAQREGRREGVKAEAARMQEILAEGRERIQAERATRKGVARFINTFLPPGLRGQFLEALATAKTPAGFSKLSEKVDNAIVKFEEAQKLKKNLATKRQKLGFIRKIGEFNQTVINEIKQEVGLTKPLTKATEAQLSEITDRLKARLRFKRARGFNPQIEGKGSPKPEIQEVTYKANRNLSVNQKSEFRRKAKEVKEAAGQTIDKLLGTISSRLADINPKLRDALRRFEFKAMTQIQRDQKAVLPFLEKAGAMSKEDHFDFDLAVKNGDTNKINELIDKYGMKAEYDKVRDTLDDIYARANEVGFDIGYQQNYFPRQIKDAEGFLEWFNQREDWSIINEAIQRKEMSLGRVLTFDEKVSLINTMIRGYSGGNITLSETGAMKQRVIDFVSPELNQFYEDSLTTLSNYIGQVDEAIEQRVFFGKSRPIDGKAEEFNNLDDSLGYYITDLITQGLISPSQEKEIRQILQARFGERGTSGAIGLYKNLSYLTLLGSPLNAVTQLGDMAFSLYAGGPSNVLTTLPQAIIGKSVISKEDIGIEKIAAEVENKSRVADLVDRIFRITGLTKIDTVGKETLINSVILKYQKIARNEAQDVEGFAAFESQMQEIFEDETAELIDDLRNDVISENVKYLAFNELLNFQPIALSEVPQVYLTAGNGRIFYALKTWTLKMLDVFRNEVFRVMRTDKVQGTKNMLRLGAWLVTMNATADVIKSVMKGEDLDDEDVQYDILVDNLLKLIGFSRYSTFQARRDGIGSAVTDQITPPTNIVDDISKDVFLLFKDSDESFDINKLKSIKNIPVIGQLYYWWFGRAAQRREKGGDRR
jgi:hypothetical protein